MTDIEPKADNKSDYIDAVRGWAILLVITCHVAGQFRELPFPIRRQTDFGWNGVQLFFLASAVTLLMSWHRRSKPFGVAVRDFFTRRYLRIAPMYYAGAILYFVAEPPLGGLDWKQVLPTLLFVNAWSPFWIPTVLPGWTVVPGGWSIGVEFTFYAVFPLLAISVTNLRRAIVFFIGALAAAIITNKIAWVQLESLGEPARENFLYFWFPNQAPIFAMGFVLYFILNKIKQPIGKPLAYSLIALALCGYVCTPIFPPPHHNFDSWTGVPPVFFATISFMFFIVALAKGPKTIFAHPWIRQLGELSFSAYVLHFLFAHHLPDWSHGLIDTSATRYQAIGMFVLLLIGTLVCTGVSAKLANRFIERPGIDLAKRLTSSRRAIAQPVASPEEGLVGDSVGGRGGF